MDLAVCQKKTVSDMQIIGLTGSIASGKSRVAYLCRQMGLPVHDSDAAAHQLMAPYGVAVPAILQKFGAVGALETGIDRPALGKMIFADPAAKSELEAILHPLISADRDRFIRQHRIWRHSKLVLDIPLLFENGLEHICDEVITVWAPAFLRRQRALQRPHMTAEKYAQILSVQMAQAEKCRLSDLSLPSGLGYAETRRRLRRWLKG